MNTMIKFLLALCLSFSFAGCAQLDEGDSPDCVEDCNGTDPDPDPCTGDDCTVDPPAGSDDWVCRPGVLNGSPYVECNHNYSTPASRNRTPVFKGYCSAASLFDYDAVPADDVSEDGKWYRIYLDNVQGSRDNPCEFTLSYCDNASDPDCWLQYGPLDVTSEEAGDLRECGVRNGVEACGMFCIPQKGAPCTDLGFYPN